MIAMTLTHTAQPRCLRDFCLRAFCLRAVCLRAMWQGLCGKGYH